MEEERVGILWSSKEKKTGGSMSYMSLCGSTGITKLNCLFCEASQPGQGSS